MMAINGTNSSNSLMWSQTVSVEPNTLYDFSLWVSNWSNAPAGTFEVRFNGVPLVGAKAPLDGGVWKNHSATWDSAASRTLTIEILNTSSFYNGNDFALDDISLIPKSNQCINPGVLEQNTAAERVEAPFTGGPSAAKSQSTYTGPTEIVVCGTGQAAEKSYSDAFYRFKDESGNDINPPVPANEFGLYINNQPAQAFLPSQAPPPYNADHVYTLQINAPGGQLTFGPGDMYTVDNTGSYTIIIKGAQALPSSPPVQSTPTVPSSSPRNGEGF
jgi:hypothetical protein